jgi:DNA-binding NtrC family response regulator
MADSALPRIAVIDDLFGRVVQQRANAEREDFCAQFLVRDVSDDESSRASRQKIRKPIADAFFFRGQSPVDAVVGDRVENDLESVFQQVHEAQERSGAPWALALVDLSFSTGPVTADSQGRFGEGMPEGRASDDEPGGYFGLRIMERLQREEPDLPVVVLSGRERGPVSREFSELGALAFLPKGEPDGATQLAELLFRHGLMPDSSGLIAGGSPTLLKVLRAARRVGPMRHNLLILGERGVGKDLLARYIHRVRCEKLNSAAPFVVLNSSVLTAELFASELFGIAERTATGVGGRRGLVEDADTGDLFADEIKDAPPVVQAGLLRVLEEGRITPIGSRKPIPVDVRFISATNGDIEALCDSGHFRHDLLDRLREGGTLHLPPLRERPSDIPALAERFVRTTEATITNCQRREIAQETIALLVSHPWPGNIRELRNCIQQAVLAHPDVEHLVPDHLRIDDKRGRRDSRRQEVPAPNESVSRPISANAHADGATELGIDDAISVMDRLALDPGNAPSWTGSLPRLQEANHRLLARCAEAALRATVKRTPDHPEGVVQIHPAAKLLTGDPAITASKAADLFKRLLGPREHVLEGILAEAYKTAIRLRPKSAAASRPIVPSP